MGRVLLAEDDADVATLLADALRREGHEVLTVADGRAALRAGLEERPELVILDVGLPLMSGLEVCRELREVHPQLPVMILTARDGELDAVAGLDSGADDYVTKPFRLAELLARVRALLRRSGPPVVEAGGVRVDRGSHRAWLGDAELELSPKEFDLLALLVGEAGRVVTRERIMDEVWDPHWFGSTKTLDMHVAWLRRKLGEPSPIVTVRGVGFRFDG